MLTVVLRLFQCIKMKSLLLCLVTVTLVVAFPKSYKHDKDEPTCGYSSCPSVNPNVLNVHIVPHSHDDVGWLKTVDQYYYGSRSSIQHAGVQFILDSVIQALLRNPERKFIYVETSFFWKWWKEQDDTIREQVRHLVDTGRLEIIGGAWSMNDEAAVHYHSTIDQFTWGFRKLNDTLGKCARPRIGWQIDPFGHSREQASLFSQFGFDGLFFARLDWRDKNHRLETKTAEMLWQGSQSLGPSSQIFTSVLYNHYMTPPGFCFDVMCPDTPIIDNENSPEYNAEAKAREFLKYVENQGKYYRTKNVIITMGGDFHYQDALSYFTNMDKLIKAIRKLDTTTRIFYSTPSCYVKAVNEANLAWSVKTDDFFPYASDPHTYWSGYFTSRPTSKRFERMGNNFLQVAKQVAAMSGSADSEPALDPLREAMGVMQHHDAITGTEKQHVADDYARMLTDAIETTGHSISHSLAKLSKQDSAKFESCLLLNISQCALTEESDKFFVTVYNSLSRPVTHYVRLPVTKQEYQVLDTDGSSMEIQYVPIPETIANIPGRESNATHELIFEADSIPPLGYKVYYVKHVPGYKPPTKPSSISKKSALTFDSNGNLASLSMNGRAIKLEQSFMYYEGAYGNNEVFENRSSGAYIFRPRSQDPKLIPLPSEVKTYEGVHVTEFQWKLNDWVSQVVRKYNKQNHVEFNWRVGPIPVEDNIGKEVIVRYKTDLDTKGIFYTDSNGREMLERRRNYRVDFPLSQEEPVALNYYPVTAKISIRDADKGVQFSVLNDRAQGGSSIKDGELELMVHRRLLHDDAFGVGEALDEKAFGTGLVATGKHYLMVGAVSSTDESNAAAKEKDLAQKILLEPWTFISPVTEDFNEKCFTNLEFSGLTKSLPPNVQILTLEPWDKDTILLRLEHVFEKDEHPELSKPVTVNIATLFKTFKVEEVYEMSLGANQLASEVNRLKWDSEHSSISNEIRKTGRRENAMEVTLSAMQIKTFVVKIKSVSL